MPVRYESVEAWGAFWINDTPILWNVLYIVVRIRGCTPQLRHPDVGSVRGRQRL